MSGPPDKYIAIPVTNDLSADLAAINEAADQGYRFEGQIGSMFSGHYQAVLMGNYGNGNS